MKMKLQSVIFFLPLLVTIKSIRSEDDIEQQFNVAANRLNQTIADLTAKALKEVLDEFSVNISLDMETQVALVPKFIKPLERYALKELKRLQNPCTDSAKEAVLDLTASSNANLEDIFTNESARFVYLNGEVYNNLTKYEGVVEELRQHFEECTVDACKVEVLETVLAKEKTIEDDFRKTINRSTYVMSEFGYYFAIQTWAIYVYEYQYRLGVILDKVYNCPAY